MPKTPTSAKYDGMPRSAIDSGCVDFVLPPREIAKELERIGRHPYARQVREASAEPIFLRGKKIYTGSLSFCGSPAELILRNTNPTPFIAARCGAWSCSSWIR